MEYHYLSETVKIKKVSEINTHGFFEIEGLYSGYGLTMGNALRRALFSSLPGAAITQIKIKGVKHEFSTIPGIKEDVVEIILNLKKVRFKFYADEPQIFTLKARGEKKITAGDIEIDSSIEIINPDAHILTLTGKTAEIDMELTIEKGLGYSMAESRKMEKLSVGAIMIDAFFTPITNVNFIIENMRVGEKTDYNRLKLEIETDGSITPSGALHKAANVLKDHLEKILNIEIKEERSGLIGLITEKKEKKAKKIKK